MERGQKGEDKKARGRKYVDGIAQVGLGHGTHLQPVGASASPCTRVVSMAGVAVARCHAQPLVLLDNSALLWLFEDFAVSRQFTHYEMRLFKAMDELCRRKLQLLWDARDTAVVVLSSPVDRQDFTVQESDERKRFRTDPNNYKVRHVATSGSTPAQCPSCVYPARFVFSMVPL